MERPRGRGRNRGLLGTIPVRSPPGGLQLLSAATSATSKPTSCKEIVLPQQTSKVPPVLPSRPDFGKNGEKIALRTNHYELKLPERIEFSHYDITITQNIVGDNGKNIFVNWTDGRVSKFTRDECKEICYKIMSAWARNFMPENFFKIVYNKQKTLYTTVFIGEEYEEDVEVERKTYHFKLKIADPPILVVDRETLRQTNFETPTERDRQPLHILDLLTNQTMFWKQENGQSNYRQHGRCFYQPMEDQPGAVLPMGRELRDGFQKSLRFVVGDPPADGIPTKDFIITMNIETKKSPFFVEQELHKTACQTLGYNDRVPNIVFTQYQRDLLRKHFMDLRCKKIHNGRNFTISGIGEKSARDEMFLLTDNNRTSVEEYFLNRYERRLEFPQLPCVKDERKNFIPMELCIVLPNQKVDLKKLTGEMSSQIIRVAAVSPDVRMRQINEKSDFMSDNNSDQFLRELNIERSKEMMKCNGRVLPPPMIALANNSKAGVQFGAWKLIGNGLFRSAVVRSFAIACLADPREVSVDNINVFSKSMINKARQLGMTMPSEMMNGDYVKSVDLKSRVSSWIQESNCTLDLVICIMGAKKLSKPKCDVKFVEKQTEVVTQCILSKTLLKYIRDPNRNETILENLVYKINPKRDGINNEIDLSSDLVAQKWFSGDVMFVGIDVNHPPPLSKKEIAQRRKPREPSIVGFVANTGQNMSDYRMWVRVQDGRQEIVSDENMKVMMTDAVKCFEASHGQKPKVVVIYRDGVSESQFGEILDREVLSMKQTFLQIGDFDPKLVVLTVQKRHNTRFFSEQRMKNGQRNADKNIPAGTVVDTGPVHPYLFDFFLCSHNGLQGTSKPSYYVCLHNELTKLDSDTMHHVTNLLCHLYQRTMKSVSLPAPVYFAHHAATRGKELYCGYANVSDDSSSGITSVTSGSSEPDLNFDEINRAINYSDEFRSRKMFL